MTLKQKIKLWLIKKQWIACPHPQYSVHKYFEFDNTPMIRTECIFCNYVDYGHVYTDLWEEKRYITEFKL